MIAFNKDQSPEDEAVKEIKKMLDSIESNLKQNNSLSNKFMHENASLSDINQIIYKSLFEEGSESIDITIYKNPNNSMDIIVNDIS